MHSSLFIISKKMLKKKQQKLLYKSDIWQKFFGCISKTNSRGY